MTFRVPKIKSCCCFSLETGTKMIGCLQMLFFLAVLAIPPIFSSSTSLARTFQSVVYESLFLNMGIFAIVMLNGAHKRDHQLLFPWILLQCIFMLLTGISLFGMIMYLGLMDTRVYVLLEVEFFLTVYYGLSILVVYNYYRELQESGSQLILS